MAATDITKTGVINAAGTATLTLRPTSKQDWIVSQVSNSAPLVGGAASCAVYRDGAFICPLIAQGDAAAGDPPIAVNNGHVMTVTWVGGTVGALVEATFFYDDGQ